MYFPPRRTITISLPEMMANEVDSAVLSGEFASRSEFFRHAIRLWEREKMRADVQKSEIDFMLRKASATNDPLTLLEAMEEKI